MIRSTICVILTLCVATLLLALQQHDPPTIVKDKAYWAWLDLRWSTEDKEFSSLRQKLEEWSALGKTKLADISKVANSSRAEFASKTEGRTVPLLKWAYAAYLANGLDPHSVKDTGLHTAKAYLESEQPIPSFEYARTRFLLHSDMFPAKYLTLGKRLLHKAPADYLVKHTLVRLYLGENIGQSKKLCHELVRDWPQKAGALALLGDVYYIADMSRPSRADLLEAKKYYEQFLKKAVASNPNMEHVKWRLGRVNKKLSSRLH